MNSVQVQFIILILLLYGIILDITLIFKTELLNFVKLAGIFSYESKVIFIKELKDIEIIFAFILEVFYVFVLFIKSLAIILMFVW